MSETGSLTEREMSNVYKLRNFLDLNKTLVLNWVEALLKSIRIS
ncbi:MAG: hypothetical protein ACI936_001821 [Paraglaciecola sp.]|jgi:hypothetical protein